MQRVKDRAEFVAELNRPFGEKVGAEDLEQDAQAFMAFAAMMGATPDNRATGAPALPSRTSA